MMKVIDIHTHIGDLIFGRPLVPYEPIEYYRELPKWAYSYDESEFDISNMQDTMTPEALKFIDGMMSQGDRGLRLIETIFNQEKGNAATLENLLNSMKKNRVDYSVLLPIEPYGQTDRNIEICRDNRNLLTFASVHPRDPEKAKKLEGYMKAGCRGLKIHPIIQGVHPSDASMRELMDEYKKYHRPVLFHTGESTYYLWQKEERRQLARLENFEEIVSIFPSVDFILGHMGQSQRDAALALCEKYQNVYVDCTLQPVDGIREALERIGADRMLFGSDFPFSLQEPHIRIINKVFGSNYAQKEKVFYKNAERLIGDVN